MPQKTASENRQECSHTLVNAYLISSHKVHEGKEEGDGAKTGTDKVWAKKRLAWELCCPVFQCDKARHVTPAEWNTYFKGLKTEIIVRLSCWSSYYNTLTGVIPFFMEVLTHAVDSSGSHICGPVALCIWVVLCPAHQVKLIPGLHTGKGHYLLHLSIHPPIILSLLLCLGPLPSKQASSSSFLHSSQYYP